MYFSGNGGPNCAKFSSPQRQVLEFIAGTTLALISLLVGISLHSYPSPIHLPFTKVSTLKLKITYLLLVSMSVTYLAEAGYKIYTYQAIFIANPCHCLCLVQIFILYRWYNQQVNNGNSKEPDLMLIYTFRYVWYLMYEFVVDDKVLIQCLMYSEQQIGQLSPIWQVTSMGAKIGDPNYTPGVDFLDHILFL